MLTPHFMVWENTSVACENICSLWHSGRWKKSCENWMLLQASASTTNCCLFSPATHSNFIFAYKLCKCTTVITRNPLFRLPVSIAPPPTLQIWTHWACLWDSFFPLHQNISTSCNKTVKNSLFCFDWMWSEFYNLLISEHVSPPPPSKQGKSHSNPGRGWELHRGLLVSLFYAENVSLL